MRTFLKHLFTGVDNSTYDLGKVLWAQLALGFLGISGWFYGAGHGNFDPIAWAGGAAAILAGGAGSIKLKQSTEPGAPDVTVPPKPAG